MSLGKLISTWNYIQQLNPSQIASFIGSFPFTTYKFPSLTTPGSCQRRQDRKRSAKDPLSNPIFKNMAKQVVPYSQSEYLIILEKNIHDSVIKSTLSMEVKIKAIWILSIHLNWLRIFDLRV